MWMWSAVVEKSIQACQDIFLNIFLTTNLKLARVPTPSPLPIAALPSMSPVPPDPFTDDTDGFSHVEADIRRFADPPFRALTPAPAHALARRGDLRRAKGQAEPPFGKEAKTL